METENIINTISLGKIIWLQFKENRISFTFPGLPKSIHFTIAWNIETGKANLHITKNTGDGKNKPKLVIANFDKYFLEDLMKFAPMVCFHKIFEPINFKKYSRKSRKNIRLLFLDNFGSKENNLLEEKMLDTWKQISTTKKHRLKIENDFEKAFLPLVKSKQTKTLLEDKLRELTSRSFNTEKSRSGIIIIGKKSYPFLTINGKCFAITKKVNPYELFTSFTESDFAHSIVEYINEALMRIQGATTFEDTLSFNRPYTLCIINAS
jgi:hypothetical protein